MFRRQRHYTYLERAGSSPMHIYVSSDLWTKRTLLLFTAQLSVHPFHANYKTTWILQGSVWMLPESEEQIGQIVLIIFISMLLPFYKKLGIFSSSLLAILVSLSSVCQHISTYLELLHYTFRFLWQVDFCVGRLTTFLTRKLHLFIPNILRGELNYSIGYVLRKYLGTLWCTALTEQIQGCCVRPSFSLDRSSKCLEGNPHSILKLKNYEGWPFVPPSR